MPPLAWAALALLALLVLLLAVPVRIEAQVKYDAPSLRLKVLFVSVQLWPPKEKHRRPKAESRRPQHLRGASSEQQAAKAGQDAAEKAGGPDLQQADEKEAVPSGGVQPHLRDLVHGARLSDLVRISTTAGGIMRLVFRVIRVRDVQLVLPVHDEDAAQTAIQYGQVQAWLGGIFGTLQNFLDFRLKQVDIIPDFAGSYKYRRYFYCKIMATPFIMMVAAIYAFTRLRAGRGI